MLLRDKHGQFKHSPITLQKYLMRVMVAVFVLGFAIMVTWVGVQIWPALECVPADYINGRC
jgi:hypothetical protein